MLQSFASFRSVNLEIGTETYESSSPQVPNSEKESVRQLRPHAVHAVQEGFLQAVIRYGDIVPVLGWIARVHAGVDCRWMYGIHCLGGGYGLLLVAWVLYSGATRRGQAGITVS